MAIKSKLGQLASMPGSPYIPFPCGLVKITATGTAAGFSPPGVGESYCVITVETANVRIRDDGTAPTASIGLLLVAGGAPFTYYGDVNAVQQIAVSGSPVFNILFYR